MSISQSLNNAVTGLKATARMAEVTSSNLSNALTEGYGRRVLDISSQNIGGQGGGVQIDGVRRIVDKGLIGDRRLADGALANQEPGLDILRRLENLLGPAADEGGLSGRIAALEQSLVTASGDPAPDRNLDLVLRRFQGVATHLNDASRQVQVMRQEADAAIARDVDTLNTALLRVERLNADIARAKATGGDPSALMDARRLAIDTVASIVPVREIARPNDAVALLTPTGLLLIDGRAMQFEFAHTPTITADMTLASGGLSGITRDGVPLDPADGFGKLSGGSLAAHFANRDGTLVKAQTALDEVAADLINRFEDPATDPTLTAGDPGLLTDAGAPYDPLDIVGLARRIAVNPAVDPAQGGALYRIRDGVNAAAAGPIGDATQIDRWADAMARSQSPGAGIPSLSVSGHAARISSVIAIDRLAQEDEVAFAASRRNTLSDAELAQGVDSDVELQNLLKIEQAYAANAKLIQTVSDMIRTLMEI